MRSFVVERVLNFSFFYPQQPFGQTMRIRTGESDCFAVVRVRWIVLEREELNVVHQYKNNGYNIVLDVNSGAIHVVDDVTYDIIAMYEAHTEEEITAALSASYTEEEIREAYE